MSILRAQSIFPMHTGIPRDVITNSLHFDWDESGTLAAAATEIATRLGTFYDVAYDPAASAANYVSWTLATVEVLDYGLPSPRVPEVRNLSFTAGTAGSTIPTECAVVMTFAAADTGGVVRQRLYNRIYFGGLGSSSMSLSTTTTFPTVSVTTRDAIALAAEGLHQSNDGILDWVQYSPITSTARPITRGWIDNSPDTQRRRSVDDTARTAINF